MKKITPNLSMFLLVQWVMVILIQEQLSPDTGLEEATKYGSYKYDQNTIIGFSHTHLNGMGEPEYRDVLLIPTVGVFQLIPGDKNDSSLGYRSRFDHKNERASPGYYSVILDDYDVKVELTSTLKIGYHKIKVKYMQCGGGKDLKVN